jgi:endonuclease/exonuclease/phosphatase family metal-dependent hydrolase
MRIVSWNCCWQKKGFTDEKRIEILKLKPDILIVQECKQDDWLKLGYSDQNGDWYGDGKESQGNSNKNLGIGIYCNGKFTIDCSLFRDQDLSNMRYALPYIVKYQEKEILTLFSVWAKSGYDYYHVPIFNSLDYFFEKTNSLVAVVGDFNTGSQHNNKENEHYYEFIKKELKTKYDLENCAFWQEWAPTFYKKERGSYNFYLDDHCFFEKRYVVSLGIGNFYNWYEYSDHMPIIIDIRDDFYMSLEYDDRVSADKIKIRRVLVDIGKFHKVLKEELNSNMEITQ